MTRCPHCNAQNSSTAAVCRLCSTPLDDPGNAPTQFVQSKAKQTSLGVSDKGSLQCSTCNTFNELEYIYCLQCGKRLRPNPTLQALNQDWARTGPPKGGGAGAAISPGSIGASSPQAQPGPEASQFIPLAGVSVRQREVLTEAKTLISQAPPPRASNAGNPPEAQPSAPQPPPANPRGASPETESHAASSPDAPNVQDGREIRDRVQELCPACSRQNGTGRLFCVYCGALMVADPASHVPRAAPNPAAPPNLVPAGRLRLLAGGAQEGEVHQLKDETVIGRTDGDIIFPYDQLLSGRHARIARRGGRFILVDESDCNGAFIKVRGESELEPGDIILIGSQVFRFE